jgi:regulator of replication initiation timing
MGLIEKIKGLFEEAEVKFAEAKLVDGTIVRCEGAFAPDKKLEFVTEDGSVVGAKEGMHELEDGTIIVVNGESIITEVRKPEVETEDMAGDKPAETAEVVSEMAETPAEEAAPETPAEDASEGNDMDSRVSAIESKLNELIDAVNALATKGENMSKENEDLKVENEALKAKTENLSKAPAETKNVVLKKFEKEAIKAESKDGNKSNLFLSKIESDREKNK